MHLPDGHVDLVEVLLLRLQGSLVEAHLGSAAELLCSGRLAQDLYVLEARSGEVDVPFVVLVRILTKDLHFLEVRYLGLALRVAGLVLLG